MDGYFIEAKGLCGIITREAKEIWESGWRCEVLNKSVELLPFTVLTWVAAVTNFEVASHIRRVWPTTLQCREPSGVFEVRLLHRYTTTVRLGFSFA